MVSDNSSVRYARGGAEAGRPQVFALGELAPAPDAASLRKAFRATGLFQRGETATLLAPGEYQVVSVESPEVPDAELKAAVRWKLKDVIDFPVEEATYDILPVPHGVAGRTPNLYAIAARNEVIRAYMDRFDEARVPLSVIDIPETAQRNISALFESEGRGIGVLFIDEAGGLFTLTDGGELILAKRIDVTRQQLTKALQDGDGREALFDRVLLNLQRTIDSFERQFRQIVVDRMLFGPEPEDTGLAAFLAANLGMKVEQMDLRSVIGFPAELNIDLGTQARFFHVIGCAVRDSGAA